MYADIGIGAFWLNNLPDWSWSTYAMLSRIYQPEAKWKRDKICRHHISDKFYKNFQCPMKLFIILKSVKSSKMLECK